MENLKHFKASEVTQAALKDKGVVLVDFWAPWCGPCRMIGPVIEELADEYAGRALVGKVNIDEEEDAAIAYRVASIPTLILFKNGVEVERVIGARPKSEFVALLNRHIV